MFIPQIIYITGQHHQGRVELTKSCKLKFSKRHTTHISQFHFQLFLSFNPYDPLPEPCFISLVFAPSLLVKLCTKNVLIPSSAFALILFCHFMPLLCTFAYKHVKLSFNLGTCFNHPMHCPISCEFHCCRMFAQHFLHKRTTRCAAVPCFLCNGGR